MPSVSDRTGSEEYEPEEESAPRPGARVLAGDIASGAGQDGHAGGIYGSIMLGLPERPGEGGPAS